MGWPPALSSRDLETWEPGHLRVWPGRFNSDPTASPSPEGCGHLVSEGHTAVKAGMSHSGIVSFASVSS